MKTNYNEKQDKYVFCKTGLVIVNLNETELETERPSMGESGNSEIIKEYQYDTFELKISDGKESSIIESLKKMKINDITEYDSSSKINSFIYNNIPLWLDKETRGGLLVRFNAEKQAGKTDTTLWAGTIPISIGINDAISMLYTLEVYASACYDNTAKHKANVTALSDAEDIVNYDYTQGYPDKLIFNV
jgi:hypothetical protein